MAIRKLTCLAILLTLPGCALMPNTVRVETEHVSHLSAGWPIEKQGRTEDGFSMVSIIGRWQMRGAYLEIGEGVNLEGRNGGGFYGPAEVFTARMGYEFRVR